MNGNVVFKLGERCRFRGSLPVEPLRMRIFRGTVSQLVAVVSSPHYRTASTARCIELSSMVVRPHRSRREDELDLRFFFRQSWLASDGADGQFVFILERDDALDGPAIEGTSMLQLPVRQGAAYFRAGVDVVIRAPVNIKQPSGGMTSSTTSPTSGADALSPALMPRSLVDCVDLQIDPRPVNLRR